jgi:hypothetical protein
MPPLERRWVHGNVFHMTTATASYEDLTQQYLDASPAPGAPPHTDMA